MQKTAKWSKCGHFALSRLINAVISMLVTPHSPHAPYEGTYQQAECNQRYKPSTAAAHLSLMWMDYKKRKPLSLALLVKLF